MEINTNSKKMWRCGEGECACGHDLAVIPLRLAAALIFILHGWGKLTGGGIGPGMEAFTGLLTSLQVPFPAFMAWVVAVVEFGGGIAVLLGIFTRAAAVLLAVNIAVGYLLVKSKMPITLGEIDISLFAISLALVGLGAGKYSIEGWWRGRKKQSAEKLVIQQ